MRLWEDHYGIEVGQNKGRMESGESKMKNEALPHTTPHPPHPLQPHSPPRGPAGRILQGGEDGGVPDHRQVHAVQLCAHAWVAGVWVVKHSGLRVGAEGGAGVFEGQVHAAQLSARSRVVGACTVIQSGGVQG